MLTIEDIRVDYAEAIALFYSEYAQKYEIDVYRNDNDSEERMRTLIKNGVSWISINIYD